MDPDRWQKVQDLFDHALGLAADDRRTFLETATTGDPDLRREVETLLTAESESAGFIDDALGEGLDLFFQDPKPAGEPERPAFEAQEPSRFGKYEILEKIGEGGFGKVYRGRDPQLQRPVAIKTCTARDPALRSRFFREARIAAGLQHPKIVTIHDFGEQEDLPYLVQELLDGEDLNRLIERRAEIPLAVQQSYLLQIARGLAYAHDNRVLHRDIKPENVRVLPGDQIKILDFGIACLVNEPQRLTREHTTVGTIGFIAPEQLRGHDLDERSDIFSFGVLAYELLALERPFEGRTFADVSYQVLHRQPIPLGRLRPDLPQPLVDLVHRCLAKNPQERYGGFQQVADHLQAIAEGDSQGPRRKSTWRGAAALLGAVAITAAVAGSIPWSSLDLQAPPSNPTAEAGQDEGRRPEIEASSSPDLSPTPEPAETGGTPAAAPPGGASSSDPAGNRNPATLSDQGMAPGSITDRPETLRQDSNNRNSPADNDSKAAIGSNEDSTRKKVEENHQSAESSINKSFTATSENPGLIKSTETVEVPATLPPGTRPPTDSPDPTSSSPQARTDTSAVERSETGIELAEQPRQAGPAQSADDEAAGPILLHRPDPRYPALAQRRGREAQVTVAVLVDASGSAQRTLVTHCSEPGLGFEEAAQEAALQASFQPAKKGEQAVTAWAELTFEFRIR